MYDLIEDKSDCPACGDNFEIGDLAIWTEVPPELTPYPNRQVVETVHLACGISNDNVEIEDGRWLKLIGAINKRIVDLTHSKDDQLASPPQITQFEAQIAALQFVQQTMRAIDFGLDENPES